jgi:N-methylhydantoinase A
MSERGRARIGIDIGGTFTDVVLVDEAAGAVHVVKLLTDHENPARAVLDGYDAILREAGVAPADVAQVCHGTTLVTNAVLERRGARTALVTTRGFRDVLEIATEDRYDMYDLEMEKPTHVVARRDVLEVDERMAADGSVRRELDRDDLERVTELLRESGHEAVAISLLHSYANPGHEIAVHDHLAAGLPGVAVTRSSDVSPELREYHRTSTTVLNAYVMPTLRGYLQEVEDGLARSGVPHALSMMLSNGGLCGADVAMAYPVRLIESGPAAGALAAAEVAREARLDGVISFDIGGTTAKACLIVDGEPLYTQTLEVARQYRFKAGSGLPLQVRSVDIIEIGTGGGSIATLDELGLVRVGPDSAGSDPGPACYGLGGSEPTVTDADLVLGYLDADYFLGGSMALDGAAAERAVTSALGETGHDPLLGAWAIRRIVDENMASAIRMYALEHGQDPSRFPLVAFGGAGPVHAVSVARILGVERVIVPAGAGVSSAHGLLVAPLSFDFVRSAPAMLDGVDWPRVDEQMRAMEAEGRGILARAGVAQEAMEIRRLCDLRFHGQGAELSVEVPAGPVDAAAADVLSDAFRARYSALYRHVPSDVALEVISWRLIASSARPGAGVSRVHEDGDAVKGTRPVWWGPADGHLETTVLDRRRLAPGDRFDGPLIVEERESTTVVDPHCALAVDERLNLIVDLHERTWTS